MSYEKLSDEHAAQFDFVQGEVQKFIDDEAYHQGIERLDNILQSIGEHEEYRLLRGGLLSRRAELFLELEDDEAAWNDAQKAMNFGWYDATVYSIAGWAMYHMDDLDVASSQFDEALKLDPDRTSSLIGRAMVHMDNESWDEARIDLSHAANVDPENAAVWAMRAEVGVALGTIDAALRDIKKARDLDPEDPDYALFHARLLTATGDVQAAAKALKASIDADETPLEALLLRSHLRLLTGDTDGAREDATQASNAFAEEAFAFVQLSHVQITRGNATLALKAAERAVSLDPSLPDGYLARATAYRLQGNDDEANADLERAESAPIELPVFLMGPVTDIIDRGGFSKAVLDLAPKPKAKEAPGPEPQAPPAGNPFGKLGAPIPGLGLDPAAMLDQVFDSDGNIKPAFKPIMRMAMKNAPNLLKSVPPSMLKNMGGIDPSQLENVDMDNISEEQLEAQMRLFYKMVKSGKNPMDLMDPDD